MAYGRKSETLSLCRRKIVDDHIPHFRSSRIPCLSEYGVFELSVSTLMFAARSAATWLFIRARSGDMTMVMPWSMTAGN